MAIGEWLIGSILVVAGASSGPPTTEQASVDSAAETPAPNEAASGDTRQQPTEEDAEPTAQPAADQAPSWATAPGFVEASGARATSSSVAASSALVAPASPVERVRVAVAVTDLRDQGSGPEVAATLTDILVIELGRFEAIEVLGRKDMVAMLEHGAMLQMLGACDAVECMTELGRRLDARFLVHGSVGTSEAGTVVTATLVDTVEARQLGGAVQTLYGGHEDLVAALRAAAVNLVGSFIATGAADVSAVPVTAEMVRELKRARRDKVWDVGLRAGGGILLADSRVLQGPLVSGRIDAEANVTPWLLVGVTAGLDWQHTKSDGEIIFGDLGSGSMVVDATTATAELLAGTAAVMAKVRRPYGLLLPYVALAAGASYMRVDLGDIIPERDDLPQFLTRTRRGESGVAFYLDGGVGMELLVADSLAVVAELRLFTYLHRLNEQVWPGGVPLEEPYLVSWERIGQIAGAALTVGATWQH